MVTNLGQVLAKVGPAQGRDLGQIGVCLSPLAHLVHLQRLKVLARLLGHKVQWRGHWVLQLLVDPGHQVLVASLAGLFHLSAGSLHECSTREAEGG